MHHRQESRRRHAYACANGHAGGTTAEVRGEEAEQAADNGIENKRDGVHGQTLAEVLWPVSPEFARAWGTICRTGCLLR